MTQLECDMIAEKASRTSGPRKKVSGRLNVGVGKSVLFLPYIGEIGWLIMDHVRLVHFSRAAHKIVCCQPGQECLFPSADEFFADWIDPVSDDNRFGSDFQQYQWPEIVARYPDAIPLLSGLRHEEEGYATRLRERIRIEPRTVRGLSVDICIGSRNRKYLPGKNYPHWPIVATALRDKGLTFAVIGTRESSYSLDGMTCMSGDFGDFDAAVELLRNCRVFIGTDSGSAHLASLVNSCPMVVQQIVSDTVANTRNCWIHRMAATTDHKVIHLPPAAWHQPNAMLDATMSMLAGTKEMRV